jgi:hypothetical protein
LEKILAILIGLLVLIAIFVYASTVSIFTVGGVILGILAVAVGIPAAMFFFKWLESR